MGIWILRFAGHVEKQQQKKIDKKIRLLQPFDLLKNSNQLMDGTIQENE